MFFAFISIKGHCHVNGGTPDDENISFLRDSEILPSYKKYWDRRTC